MIFCDLCKKSTNSLTPIDFSNIVWKDKNSFQMISKNPDLKRLKLYLCYDCHTSIFHNSFVGIYFKLELYEALRDVKEKEKVTGEFFING